MGMQALGPWPVRVWSLPEGSFHVMDQAEVRGRMVRRERSVGDFIAAEG